MAKRQSKRKTPFERLVSKVKDTFNLTNTEKKAGTTEDSQVEPEKFNEVLETTATEIDIVSENQVDVPVMVESPIPIKGVLDSFKAPNLFSGWAYVKDGMQLRVRVMIDSLDLGETAVDILRPTLKHMNEGNVGWRIKSSHELTEQDFFADTSKIKVFVIDEDNNIIGTVPVWSKLIENHQK